MHDLNTINRLNREHWAANAAAAAKAAGQHFIAKYDGLHLVDGEAVAGAEAATARRDDLAKTAMIGETFKVIAPH
jgi:hypothetical protein